MRGLSGVGEDCALAGTAADVPKKTARTDIDIIDLMFMLNFLYGVS